MKTDDELKNLAIDIANHKVFTTNHIREGEDHMISSIFLPIGLGVLADKTEEELSDIAMFYEYMDKAGPRSINGYPIFFSVNILTLAEHTKVWDYYNAYQDAHKEIVDKL